MELIKKIEGKNCRIGIIGLGYVGLPLSLAFVRAGFNVVGIDTDARKIKNISSGVSYITDVKDGEIKEATESKRFTATSSFDVLRRCDVVIICVPTPLNKTKDPDISYLLSAAEEVSKYLGEQLIVVESTTYPGTTREDILPVLQRTGKVVGKDFYLAYSPERVDPSNKNYGIYNTPKIVGGVTKKCTKIAKTLYEKIVEKVVVVSSVDCAEMVKIFENVFRSVNIALVNELALLCNIMGISVWEVIEAAATKPYGFMKFLPGPGLGGHCIPIDPFYLSWKAREFNFRTRFIELSGEINENMPNYVVYRIRMLLNEKGKAVKNSHILLLGVAYKKDVNDDRESPSLKIIRLLRKNKARVVYNDPYIKEVEVGGEKYKSCKLTEKILKQTDLTVILTDHSIYDWEYIVKHSCLVFDARGVLYPSRQKNVVFL